MPNSTISSKGQVTIPKEVRDALRLDTGDRVEFVLRTDGVVEMWPDTVDLIDLAETLVPPNGRHATIEEIQRAIARRAGDSYRESGSR